MLALVQTLVLRLVLTLPLGTKLQQRKQHACSECKHDIPERCIAVLLQHGNLLQSL